MNILAVNLHVWQCRLLSHLGQDCTGSEQIGLSLLVLCPPYRCGYSYTGPRQMFHMQPAFIILK